jgi:hypothetical protein
MIDYSSYSDFAEYVAQTGQLGSFKTNSNYSWVLEHVSPEQGSEYIHYIKTLTNLTDDDIREYCMINDSNGSPNRSNYGFVTASPTSLRYIFHAHLILKHMQMVNRSPDIVEVGGGYGGLCVALHHFSERYKVKINSYTVVDLPSVSKLQKLYVSTVNPALSVNFVDATTFGAGITTQNMFLISNYCFSEISADFQKKYIETLFPKVSHGFMAWNMIPTYDFGFDFKKEIEYPKTGDFNYYLYF